MKELMCVSLQGRITPRAVNGKFAADTETFRHMEISDRFSMQNTFKHSIIIGWVSQFFCISNELNTDCQC